MFQIKWMPEAEQEYYATLEYWIEHNKSTDYSLKIIQEVERFEDLLISNPHLGRMTSSELSVLKITMLDKFYIYYNVTENTINVLAFKSTSEDYQKHELGILIRRPIPSGFFVLIHYIVCINYNISNQLPLDALSTNVTENNKEVRKLDKL